MKLLCILVLSGVACCLASSSSCFQKEASKCRPSDLSLDYREFRFNKNSVDKYCKLLKCWVSSLKRCGYSTQDIPSPLRRYKQVYEMSCSKNSHLRQKMIRSMSCMADAMKTDSFQSCQIDRSFDRDQVEYCRRLQDSFECSEDTIHRFCGAEAGEVYAAFYADKEPYGC